MSLNTDKKWGGFASMDPALQLKIASMGGKAAHKKGRAHEFTSEEAIEAGRRGGIANGAKRRAERAAKLAGESDAV